MHGKEENHNMLGALIDDFSSHRSPSCQVLEQSLSQLDERL